MRTYLIKDTFISPLGAKSVTSVAIVKAKNKAQALESFLFYLMDKDSEIADFELVKILNQQVALMYPSVHLHENKAGRKAIDPLQKKVKFISYIKASYLEPFKGKIPAKVLEQIDNSIISILEQNTHKK
jgi:hypothetical protein